MRTINQELCIEIMHQNRSGSKPIMVSFVRDENIKCNQTRHLVSLCPSEMSLYHPSIPDQNVLSNQSPPECLRMSEAVARDKPQSMLVATSASPTTAGAAKHPSPGGERGQSQLALALGPPPQEKMRKTTIVNGEGNLALRWAALSACRAACESRLTSSLLDRKGTAQMKRLQKAVNWRDCSGSDSP
jgi:hypothetical protein